MRKQITTGSLSNEQIFHVIQLTIDDLPLILQLQTKVENALVSNTFLSPLSRKEFTRILTGKGFMLGVFIDEKLIAFRAMLQPEMDEEHLGLDAGLPEAELPKVIYSEISNVDPEYRGNGLQKYMGQILMNEIDYEKFRYVCATVAPMNIPSIKDKFSLGLEIVALKEKYQGKLRYIFIKDLSIHSKNGTYNELGPCRENRGTAGVDTIGLPRNSYS
ncbi:N-acetyltransferase [Virgibacillus dakarensis]|uniref:GNAT family N-acetyltransferase n=1 Tax=Virgibacillus dakarensis TaxID=1917889 RepID=UPI0011241A50|nr:GNAT family N-acetyltransferase [Virgibacillus dakarensis]